MTPDELDEMRQWGCAREDVKKLIGEIDRLNGRIAAALRMLEGDDASDRAVFRAVLQETLKGEPVYPAPGSAIPDMLGYVVGQCTHRVAASEWRAGFRVCERCPSREAAG